MLEAVILSPSDRDGRRISTDTVAIIELGDGLASLELWNLSAYGAICSCAVSAPSFPADSSICAKLSFT